MGYCAVYFFLTFILIRANVLRTFARINIITMPRISRERLRLFAHYLRQQQRPLVQETDLAVCFMLALQEAGDLNGDLDVTTLKRDFRKFKAALLEFGGLEEFKEGGQSFGYLVGLSSLPDMEESICSLDPFAYISHLSAMAWHGLTNRLPNTLFLTRPSASLWKKLSDSRLEGQLKSLFPIYQQARFPSYQRVAIQKLKNRPLNIWSSGRLDKAWQAAYKKVDGKQRRVATVGRCFLDMVREPALCGGIYHVIEVFEEHGAKNAEQILADVDAHGNKLEQARVGYLLERADPELVAHPILKQWASGVTRGGSRKLDPTSDYSAAFSERWALSINV